MLYSCTHTVAVGVKVLNTGRQILVCAAKNARYLNKSQRMKICESKLPEQDLSCAWCGPTLTAVRRASQTYRDAFNDKLWQKLLPANLFQVLNVRLLLKCLVLHVFKKQPAHSVHVQ